MIFDLEGETKIEDEQILTKIAHCNDPNAKIFLFSGIETILYEINY